MFKIISMILTLLFSFSMLFADEEYLPKKKFKGTANGIIILKKTLKDTNYFILDFQGSKSYTEPECSCHFGLTAETTSGRSKFAIMYPHFDVSVFVELPNKGVYETHEFVESKISVTTKIEKGMKYIIYHFKNDIELIQREGEREKFYIDNESVLVIAFKTYQ